MSQPNVLVIMSDEHQARAMGCAGHDQIRTPNLDALAARGTLFENAYTPCPICVPARASFATGRYVHETRLWDNAMPYAGQMPGWGHALQNADVPVESIGKLHYRAQEDPAGFDVEHIPMMVANGVGMVWGSIRREGERVAGTGRMLGEYIGPGESKYTEYDRSVVAKTEGWFKSRAASGDRQPWCLYVGLVAPHFPLVVPKDYFDLYPLDTIKEPKLSLRGGYTRHAWAEKQNDHMDNEAKFTSDEERLSAIAAYFGLCTWLDDNVGRILTALEDAGFGEDTLVVYCSDHGDNLGTRGLWGKSTLYQESTAVPMIMAGPGVPVRRCTTPVSLLDLSVTIPQAFGVAFEGSKGLRPLTQIAREPDDPEREVFSEYHAVGAVSGAYMLRHGRWKYHHYVGFPPELFDLETDPEETRDLATDPAHASILADMERRLRQFCDPEAVNARAFADQDAMIDGYGGREAALAMGMRGATPPPANQDPETDKSEPSPKEVLR
ncbi:MAG: sulfatase-like hydrolase/transferase [Pseudomonadota bacterium]|nr:sulfatase-like hydrolase/transferase [Pseudomonadota bacterium]